MCMCGIEFCKQIWYMCMCGIKFCKQIQYMCMFGIKICKQILPKIGLADGETEAYFSKKPKHFWPKYFTCTTFPEFQFVFASKSNTCTCLESNFASKSVTMKRSVGIKFCKQIWYNETLCACLKSNFASKSVTMKRSVHV